MVISQQATNKSGDAARKAQVHSTIEKLPDGYATKVGERGLMISGGEKQRLAVARLLLKDPQILFFDEATSMLDVYTETELMRNINSTLIDGTKTSVFIAHRLRTISDAGRSLRRIVAECRFNHCAARGPSGGAGLT